MDVLDGTNIVPFMDVNYADYVPMQMSGRDFGQCSRICGVAQCPYVHIFNHLLLDGYEPLRRCYGSGGS